MHSHDTPEIMLAIGRLEGKVDALLQMQRIQEDQIKLHEERIRDLEHSRSFALGIAGVFGAASSLLITFVIKTLSGT